MTSQVLTRTSVRMKLSLDEKGEPSEEGAGRGAWGPSQGQAGGGRRLLKSGAEHSLSSRQLQFRPGESAVGSTRMWVALKAVGLDATRLGGGGEYVERRPGD